MKKVLVLVLVLILSVGASFGLMMVFTPDYDRNLEIHYDLIKPNFDDIDLITNLSVPKGDKEKRELAYQLYQLANENDQKVDSRMYYSFCPTNNIAMGIPQKIDLYIFNIKDGNEFFRIDYRVKNSVPILDVMPSLNSGLELITTERQYYKSGMNNLYYEKVRNATLDFIKGFPTAEWRGRIKKEKRDVPFYNKDQALKYEKSDHTILTETISDAEIEKTKDGVKVKITLDCENKTTTQNTKPLIEKGAKDDNAKYDSIIVEFELWSNGFYKIYKQWDAWSAKTFGIDVSSTFEYVDEYVYDRDIYRLDKWEDAQAIKEICKNGFPKI